MRTTHSTRRQHRFWHVLALAVALAVAIAAVPGTASAATLVVTNTNDSGAGSFRAALISANATPGHDTITFNIGSGGVRTIFPKTPLPVIAAPVTIDGKTQPGNPSGLPRIGLSGVQLDPKPLASEDYALQLTSDGNTIRGLAIRQFGVGLELVESDNNVIRGNHIGTDFTGTLNLPNEHEELLLRDGSDGNTIGGAAAGDRNVIGSSGILMHDSSGNVIRGNYVGLNASGTDELGFGGSISSFDYSANPAPGVGNVIGGSGPGEGNVIACAAGAGGPWTQPLATMIQGNRIGTDVTGTKELCSDAHNGNLRVRVGGIGVTVGGATAGAGNQIAGRVEFGGTGVLRGNRIGTNALGTAALGGVASHTLVYITGYDVTVRDNLISGVGWNGLYIRGDRAVVKGNRIGTNAAGVACLGSFGNGIFLEGSDSTVIGGTQEADGNLVSCNGEAGILLGATSNVRIQGNLIGTNAEGMGSLANFAGIRLAAQETLIGGLEKGAGNIIAGNLTFGIQAMYSNTERNVILGNRIGGLRVGERITPGNGDAGIYFGSYCPKNNVVGGTAGGGNVIAYNGGPGVAALCGIGNSVRGNSIYANDNGLGIDLQPIGHTDNDSGDADTGPNDLQNHPEITVAAPASGGGTFVEGELHSVPNTRFRLDVYANTSCDPTGFGEGERFLGTVDVTTDSVGHGTFEWVFPAAAGIGPFVSVTATNPENSTSEFSPCKPVTAQADLAVGISAPPGAVQTGAQLTYKIDAKNNAPSDADALAVVTSVPVGAAFVSVQASPGGNCTTNSSNGVVNVKCDWLGPTTKGQTRTVVLVVTPLGPSSLVLQATTASSTFDPDGSNNAAELQTPVV